MFLNAIAIGAYLFISIVTLLHVILFSASRAYNSLLGRMLTDRQTDRKRLFDPNTCDVIMRIE